MAISAQSLHATRLSGNAHRKYILICGGKEHLPNDGAINTKQGKSRTGAKPFLVKTK